MDFRKNFFIFIFLLFTILLWYFFQTKFSSNFDYRDNKHISKEQLKKNMISKSDHLIYVKTDVFNIIINKEGGDIEQTDLLKYTQKLGSSKHLRLLEKSPNYIYQAQSGLIRKNIFDNSIKKIRPFYTTAKNFFNLEKNSKELKVPMRWISKDGLVYVKTFTFKPEQYVIDVQYDIYNNTKDYLEMSMFGQLKQTINLSEKKGFYKDASIAIQTFRGTAYSTSDNKYSKCSFNSIQKNKNILTTTNNGWIAMLQQYFATAWVPQNQGKNTIYTKYLGNDIAAIGYKSDVFHIQPYIKYTINTKLWIGPEIQEKMALVAPYLDLTVDYGWLWFFSQPLFKLLHLLYELVHNWGIAIVLITFIMKMMMFPLSKMQYTSIAKMRFLQPKINKIREKYYNDKQKMNQEIMRIYQSEKLNPLGGCLPLILQMPIFLALYYMLIGSVELRHAPFILWINDLSDKDPYYILPILMGCTMFLIQKMSPNNSSDPMQQKIMNFMPIIFTAFFLWFPSGLVLYYIVSNCLTLLQQKIVFKNLEKR